MGTIASSTISFFWPATGSVTFEYLVRCAPELAEVCTAITGTRGGAALLEGFGHHVRAEVGLDLRRVRGAQAGEHRGGLARVYGRPAADGDYAVGLIVQDIALQPVHVFARGVRPRVGRDRPACQRHASFLERGRDRVSDRLHVGRIAHEESRFSVLPRQAPDPGQNPAAEGIGIAFPVGKQLLRVVE
jgi:hypothetical protein